MENQDRKIPRSKIPKQKIPKSKNTKIIPKSKNSKIEKFQNQKIPKSKNSKIEKFQNLVTKADNLESSDPHSLEIIILEISPTDKLI